VSRKTFFTRHAKSSAAFISLGIHALLVVVALSYVAVTVITKEDQVFEAKKVNRPKMQLKKLQVPVNIKKKKTRKPKLRKRIVVQPRLNQNMPDIKMPEISGIKGGIGGVGGSGLGGAGGIGFSMPEINLFGVKSKGEKIFLILDSTPWIMYDEIGGIPAYTLIKEELIHILSGLNPTILFNIAVYDGRTAVSRFPAMVPATSSNVGMVTDWLTSLNAVKKGMGDRDYGTHTLGQGGITIDKNLAADPIINVRQWSQPVMLAMQQQADSVFVLTQGWGNLHHDIAAAKQWSESKMEAYRTIGQKARKKLREENVERRKNGDPPRVLVGRAIINTYFPGTEHPPAPERHYYSPEEMLEAFSNRRESHKPQIPTASGLGNKKRNDQNSINVIHFVSKDKVSEKDQARFKKLTTSANGSYKTLAGLDAIKSSASGH
jgi:hypothetical protein